MRLVAQAIAPRGEIVSAPRASRYITGVLALSSWVVYAFTASFYVAIVASLLTGATLVMINAHVFLADRMHLPHRPTSETASERVSSAPVVQAQAASNAGPSPQQADDPPPPFTAPSDSTPDAVVQALLTNARRAGEPVAAHIWVEDTASGTLRQIAAAGLMSPPSAPEPIADGLLGAVLIEGRARFDHLRQMTSPTEKRTIWRYAFPLRNVSSRTVAAVDFIGVGEPDSEIMNTVAASMAAPLSGAVSLALADRREQMVRALVDVAHALSRRLDPDDVISETLETAVDISSAATASLMLLEDDRLTIAAAHGLPREVVESTSISIGEGIAGWVAMTAQPLLVEDLPSRDGRGERHGVRSAVSVPIADDDGLIGVLNVGSRAYPAHYDQQLLDVLESLGRQAAVALRNAEALAVAEDMFYGSLRALVVALETKDPYSRGATERVADMCVELGREMDLPQEELQALEIAALLHDIGMDSAGAVRAAGGPMTTVERGLVNMHPKIAADILDKAPALRLAVPIVYHHHEHYDGRGYVDGLEGDAIPMGARILSIVDSYVAMTSPRAYREAFSVDRALTELEAKAGTQFDPSVVPIFIKMVRGEANRAPERTS